MDNPVGGAYAGFGEARSTWRGNRGRLNRLSIGGPHLFEPRGGESLNKVFLEHDEDQNHGNAEQ